MTPHSENAMARFLFAILKQKSLRDIDWNQVASDPVLLEPISNGHAARMRFFRFRSTVSGHKSNRRVSEAKARVTKPKKDESQNKTIVKTEILTPGFSTYDQFSPPSTSLASPYVGETQDDFDRYLTPCSDDMTQPLAVHPAALEKSRIHSMPLFPPASCSTDFLNHAVHEPPAAHHAHSPSLPAFDAAYEFDGYGVKRELHGRQDSNTSPCQDLTDCTHDWDDRFNDTQQF